MILLFLVEADFCEQNGNGCVVIETNIGDAVYCCCDTDLCNDESNINGAEGLYFSVFAISFTLVMAMAI